LGNSVRRTFLKLSAGAALGAALPASQGTPTWVFGVLNQQSLARTAARWNPVLAHLAQKTGQSFVLSMGPTVDDTNAMMARGEFDFLFSNHNFQPEYDALYGVVARLAGPPIHGVVAVSDGSSLHRLSQLAGLRVAFPSKEAFVAYAVPMLAFKRAKVKVEPVFAGTQDAALLLLKSGKVSAAAVNSRFLTQFAAKHGLGHRVIHTSEGFADLPVSAHPRVPPKTVAAVREALLGMATDADGQQALAQAEFAGFAAASEQMYANVRRTYREAD
jgi:phosphonate transport system substrate-binding protein